MFRLLLGIVAKGILIVFAVVLLRSPAVFRAAEKPEPADGGYDWQLHNDSWKTPFKDEKPIYFVNRSQSFADWEKLPKFWNESVQKEIDPKTLRAVERQVVKIKVPLGLTQNPPVPVENPMTVAKWDLGKRLYFDPILSSDRTVSCATCHDPKRGFTDQSSVSTGIFGKKGGMSAPTVYNSAYNLLQFWDGRATWLEDQSQGPVQNPVEMFDGKSDSKSPAAGHAWHLAIRRLRADPTYVKQFKAVFGTEPTRDAAAKAIACYERTVLSGNSIHDRAEVAMRKRAEDEETVKLELKPKDYETVLKIAFAAKDTNALGALGLDPAKDAGKIAAVAASLSNGRTLFFNKRGCSACHAGENFTDNQFHNLGVGVKDGVLPQDALGRFGVQPLGQKNPDMVGAFKTPTLRHLVHSAPYMHNGSEATLEKVVDFYDKGGNANEYLDAKMRSFDEEKKYHLSLGDGPPYKGAVALVGKANKPIIPLKLNLTVEEKKDLVLFLKALQGDSADLIIAESGREK